ncbi:MAG: DUF1232 domain-containing protein [Chloroflexia bacterium]|nr:DUF1232 domain-containing protein [Chloroflexia bacterium]
MSAVAENLEPTGSRAKADALAQERREALRAFWTIVKRMPAYGRLVAAMAKDPGVPHRARAMLVVGGAYMVSPIDLVPGVIPVAGQLDDLYVLLMAIRQAVRMSPTDVADRHLARLDLERETLDDDLATIRRLVRVGLKSGAGWGWGRVKAGRRRVKQFMAHRRGEES